MFRACVSCVSCVPFVIFSHFFFLCQNIEIYNKIDSSILLKYLQIWMSYTQSQYIDALIFYLIIYVLSFILSFFLFFYFVHLIAITRDWLLFMYVWMESACANHSVVSVCLRNFFFFSPFSCCFSSFLPFSSEGRNIFRDVHMWKRRIIHTVQFCWWIYLKMLLLLLLYYFFFSVCWDNLLSDRMHLFLDKAINVTSRYFEWIGRLMRVSTTLYAE